MFGSFPGSIILYKLGEGYPDFDPAKDSGHATVLVEHGQAAAGIGADRVLFVHDGSVTGHDLFQAILTTLDPQVLLTLAHFLPVPEAAAGTNGFKRPGRD